MDPNANLKEQEDLYVHWQRGGHRLHAAFRNRLIELQRALANWLRNGGFEPNWELAPNARKYYKK